MARWLVRASAGALEEASQDQGHVRVINMRWDSISRPARGLLGFIQRPYKACITCKSLPEAALDSLNFHGVRVSLMVVHLAWKVHANNCYPGASSVLLFWQCPSRGSTELPPFIPMRGRIVRQGYCSTASIRSAYLVEATWLAAYS